MALSRDLALTDAERDEILSTRVEHAHLDGVAVGPDQLDAAVVRAGTTARIWAYCRGQKVENMRRDPRCTVLVDRNERFPELQGIMIQGDVTILEDAAAEAAEPGLAEVREIMGRKYHGGHGEAAGGRADHRWRRRRAARAGGG